MNFPDLPFRTPTGLKLIGYVLFALAAAIAAWFFLLRPQQARQAEADARATEAAATAQAGASEETVRIVVDHNAATQEIIYRTERSSNDIRNAPGSGDTIDPALHTAGILALCLHDNREGEPACDVLLHRDGGGERP